MRKLICSVLCLSLAAVTFAAEFTPAKLSEHRTPDHDPAAYLAPKPHGNITDQPRVRWQVPLGTAKGSGSVKLADLTGDGVDEALHLDAGSVRAYDLDGKLLWDARFLGVNQMVIIGDIDDGDDAQIEVVLGNTSPTDAKLVLTVISSHILVYDAWA